MLATPGPLPTGPQWAFEVKFDGIRLICTLRSGRLRLTSRNGKDLTAAFPELQELATELTGRGATSLILDGELVARGALAPTLQAIAPRIHRSSVTPDVIAAHPVTYVVFDVMERAGEDLTQQPLRDRAAVLLELLENHPGWHRSEVFSDGAALWEATRAQGLEGVVAKRWSSPYRSGVRSRDWIKAVHRSTTDLVVIGWRPESGRRARIGSLVLAEVSDGELRYVGSAGSGMTQAVSDALLGVLPGIRQADSPITVPGDLPDTNWVAPALVVQVRHLGHTGDQQLRQPVITSLRPDLTAQDLLGLAD